MQNTATIVVSEPLSVRARLRELGVTLEVLSEAVMAWVRADAGTSPFEPPTAPGSKGWFACTGLLRETLVTEGWRAENIKNWPVVVHPQTSLALCATSGDEYTGMQLDGVQPSTKNRKGLVVQQAVEISNQMVLLFGDYVEPRQTRPRTLNSRLAAKTQYRAWILLVFVTSDGARSELSLPRAIDDERIVDWHERIILPVMSRTAPPDMGEDDLDDEPVDVPVERRKG